MKFSISYNTSPRSMRELTMALASEGNYISVPRFPGWWEHVVLITARLSLFSPILIKDIAFEQPKVVQRHFLKKSSERTADAGKEFPGRIQDRRGVLLTPQFVQRRRGYRWRLLFSLDECPPVFSTKQLEKLA